ncbi:hypothetical protein [Kushneria phosphatilytica]|uniref:YbjQ family protein n=1 Tax=Kushneria phosphatilytica TaxID=657387 RepID=A0A1S1NX10_9GAMM|nr:hypothetical protein [Kushneria phosphatilytica]OHV10543.1 hypothetical protein BH688_09110 [Kushneria phosphatilytica]QEL11886.1 YbjQ family protein [Kushneria phosphatilytica]
MTPRAILTATLLGALLSLGLATDAQARNDFLMQPLANVFSQPEAQQQLDPSIQLFFADQLHPDIKTRRGGYFATHKVSSVLKSDEEACRQAALESLLDLQKRAREVGANAVVNIVSYYDQRANPSDNRYECHAGNVITEVAFKGDLVTIDKQ